ncbi:MAG: hypothetical protein RI932_2051 [Pseudomonadota bacterium]
MSQFQTKSESTRSLRTRARRSMWFWRGILVAAVTHSVLAAADFSVDVESVWSETGESISIHSPINSETPKKIVEFELNDNSRIAQVMVGDSAETLVSSTQSATSTTILDGLKFSGTSLTRGERSPESESLAKVVAEPDADEADENNSDVADSKATVTSGIQFPEDVPTSEILRVSRTFHGMVQESMRQDPRMFSGQFAGTLVSSEPMSSEKLAELETTLLDESASSDDGYALGQEVDSDFSSLDPFKTYTVVDGRIHAVTPTQVARPAAALEGSAEQAAPMQTRPMRSDDVAIQGAQPQKTSAATQSADARAASSASAVALELPRDEVSKGMSQVLANQSSAALDAASAGGERVSIQGRVSVPEGFARNKVVLRMAGTPFQVQTDASGAFELRDIPRGTRFELLVWHLDGSLTRRLVPVTASGREKTLEIVLQKVSDVDALAGSFGLLQHMNQGGFCARVDSQSPEALIGGRVFVAAGRKNLQAYFFSESGLPSSAQSELSSDGRFCVFNVDESLADVKITLVNGARRQFVVHVEPSTFEHDLVFDVSESIYRKVSLLEPLDTQQVFELSTQGVQPDFGDRRLRDWLNGTDVPVWTRVGRYLLQSDPAYSVVRPNGDDVQFFPGGQEFVELRVAPDVPGSLWSRVLLSRDDLMSNAILKQVERLGGRVYQDRDKPMSMAALDVDAWDELVGQNPDIPRLGVNATGGLYVSVDPSGLNARADDLVISVRDTWTGKDVCQVIPLRGSNEIKSTRFIRAVCGANPGQYALILETREGALLWSDVVRIRAGDVQTVTVFDPKF